MNDLERRSRAKLLAARQAGLVAGRPAVAGGPPRLVERGGQRLAGQAHSALPSRTRVEHGVQDVGDSVATR